jgi:hypothetical protein
VLSYSYLGRSVALVGSRDGPAPNGQNTARISRINAPQAVTRISNNFIELEEKACLVALIQNTASFGALTKDQEIMHWSCQVAIDGGMI